MVHYEIVFSVKDTYEGSCFKICPKEVSVALPFKMGQESSYDALKC